MAKRKRKKISSTLTWKTVKGALAFLFQGLFKAAPLLVFFAIGTGIFWGIRQELYADPGFLIRRIEVLPEGILKPEKVQSLERLYLGQNIFKVSLREAAQGIETDPSIRQAEVTRDFPKTLRVVLKTRTPFAQVQLRARGPYYRVAEDRVFLGTSLVREDALLGVDVFENRGPAPEQGKEFLLPGLAEGLTFARAFWTHPLSRSEAIGSIRLDPLGNVTIVLRKGPELRFGRRPMEKFKMLDAVSPLLNGADRDRISYIELQYHDLVVRRR